MRTFFCRYTYYLRIACLLSLGCALLSLGGCASMASGAASRLAQNLSTAMQDHDDPETVAAAMPSYMLLTDGLIQGHPDNEKLLLSGSKLYAAYASVFVQDPARAKRLALRARDYGDRALCVHDARLCKLWDRSLADFSTAMAGCKADDVPVLYASGAAWAVWLQTSGKDLSVLAQLLKVRALMTRVVALNENYSHGEAHVYIGVIDTLLPPALGGKPEEGRSHFERAIQLSGGHDLMDQVEYAKRYARLTHDRQLYESLLKQVLAADADVPGLTLSNVLAQRQARAMLANESKYF